MSLGRSGPGVRSGFLETPRARFGGVFLASAQTVSQSAGSGASTPRVRRRSEAVNIDHGQLVGRHLKDCPVVMDLHELYPVDRRATGIGVKSSGFLCRSQTALTRLRERRRLRVVAANNRWRFVLCSMRSDCFSRGMRQTRRSTTIRLWVTPSPNPEPGLVRESSCPVRGCKGFSNEEATQCRADGGLASAG